MTYTYPDETYTFTLGQNQTQRLFHQYSSMDGFETVDNISGSVPGMTISLSGSTYEGYWIISGVPTSRGSYHLILTGQVGSPQSIPEDTIKNVYINVVGYTVTVTSAGNGTVSGGGIYGYGQVITISATPNGGYRFSHWSDGNTNATRSITVTSDISLTAYFVRVYQITWKNWDNSILKTDYLEYGETPTYGDTIPTRPATAQYTYTFTGWSPTPVTVVGDATYTAQYSSAINSYTVSLTAEGNGTVSGAGTYEYGTTVTITAVADEHHHLAQWSDEYTSPTRTVQVIGPISLTATFVIDRFTVTASTDGNGTVLGAGTYDYNTTIQLTAVPGSSYEFREWSDGLLTNPRTLTVTADFEISAYFETVDGSLVLSYSQDGKKYSLKCETVTVVDDDIRANVLQTPIPVYSADNAFAFDTGSTENLQFTIVRRNPDIINDPDLGDNLADIYELDWSVYDTSKWSNRVWKMALVSMIDRWQMKSDGVSVLFVPYIRSRDEGGTIQGLYHAPIDERGYIKTLNITYDISSYEVLKVTLGIAIGSINKG